MTPTLANRIYEARLQVYIAGLTGAVALTATLLLLAHQPVGTLWIVGVLALAAAVAERASVRLTSRTEESISLLPTLFAAVLFGPLAAMVVGAVSNLGDFRAPYMKWAVYTCTRALGGAVAGLVTLGTGSFATSGPATVAITTALGALALVVLDIGFSVLTRKIKWNGSAADLIRTVAPAVLPAMALWAPVVGLLAFAYQEISPWTLPLFVVPALAAHRSFVLYQQQRRLTEDLLEANQLLQGANLSFATALVATLDARDRYTAGHSAAVAIYSRDIAERMALPPEEQQLVHLCGLVHDIGKIGLTAGLLEKAGPLTLDERRQMQEHPAIGERILSKVESYSEIARVVRHHHERVDGNGYPDGLVNDAIPRLSRIIAVADAYNALTSDRPYRDAMPSRVARMRLAQAVESQFDTTVVAAFEAILATSDEEYRLGTRPDFNFDVQESGEEPSDAIAGAA
jgi:putative nucleotidyltransferase with HDIG domain